MTSPILKKISLIILITSLGSILILGLLINTSLNRQFHNYLVRIESVRQQQILKSLAEIYRYYGGWPDRVTGINMGRVVMGNLLYVTDLQGRVVITSRRSLRIPEADQLIARPVLINTQKVGTAYFGKTVLQNILSRQDEMFRATINRSIVISIIITSLLSVLIAVLFARRLSVPITEMNRIAKDMAAGNLESRVQDLPHDELGELGKSLNQLAVRLKEAEDLRKKMTADVAHDLRTPLATVRSHLEGMIDEVIPARRDNLESLLEEVNRLTRLVADLQAIVLTDRAVRDYNIHSLNLKVFLTDLAKRMEPLFREKQVQLRTAVLEDAIIKTDADALAKIFYNLLSNAYKFTPSGKGVKLSMEQADNYVDVFVADEGIGIAEADLPYIFERFYRADQSRNRESGGFGLGLTIVKELLTALGGKIEVTSQPGKGSTFKVRLPRRTGKENE